MSSSLQSESLLRQFVVDGAIEPEQESEGNNQNEDEVEPHYIYLVRNKPIDMIKISLQSLQKYTKCD